MLFNTTYYNKSIEEEIIATLGKPFSPLSVIKIGVIGSSRMIVDAYSARFAPFIEINQDLTYASIGLRPKGILVTLSKSYKNLSWIIPYHHLSIYKTDVLSIHSNGEFLKLQLKKEQNRKFIAKILFYKNKYLNP